MTNALTIENFPVTTRWTPKNPEILQLFSYPTPNGVKVSIALEEIGVDYEAHNVALSETTTPEFLSLNPNNKIPAIIDPNGPGGKPLPLWESGAILIYLAEKHKMLLPDDPADRFETFQWLMFQMGGIGPMFGQFGHFFKFAADKIEGCPYPMERYRDEAKRLLGVLEQRLEGRQWIMGDTYTIADIATFPWVYCADVFYGAAETLDYPSRTNIRRWFDACMARPASIKGLDVPAQT